MSRKIILFYSSIRNSGIQQKKIVNSLAEVEILLVDICHKNLTPSKREMMEHYNVTSQPFSVLIEDGIILTKLEGNRDIEAYTIHFNDN